MWAQCVTMYSTIAYMVGRTYMRPASLNISSYFFNWEV